MIPAIIHYCWFSTDPMPQLVLDCIASWRHHCPEWELRLWDMDAVRNIDNDFLQEALAARKWAFAADFIRVYAVECYGGVYLDTDVELRSTLEPFRKHACFIGRETTHHMIGRALCTLTSHCFGAEAGHPYIKDCLSYYDGRHFITSANTSLPPELRMDLQLMPLTQALIAERHGYDARPRTDSLQECDGGMTVYPRSVFAFVHTADSSSVCYHHCAGSWRPGGAQTLFKARRLPLWRRAIGYLNLRDRMAQMLHRMGYVVIHLD